MQTTVKSGRKPVDPLEKKQPITIYIKQSHIKTIGGKPVVRQNLIDYINIIIDAKQSN